MVKRLEGRMKELKKRLNAMTKSQLSEFMSKNDVFLTKKIENLTKSQIVEKIIDHIEQVEFWTEYYS